jgi:hypothetical protein
MITKVPKEKEPDLLLEAARVLNAAGPAFEDAAAALAAEALKVRDRADPDVRDAITADAAALYLSGRLPGGYEEALKVLDPVDKAADTDGRLHLLHALALGQKYNAVRKSSKERAAPAPKRLRSQIRKDLSVAFARNPSLREENKGFWDPKARLDRAGREDDLQKVFEDDDQFKLLVEPSSAKKIDEDAKRRSAKRAKTAASRASAKKKSEHVSNKIAAKDKESRSKFAKRAKRAASSLSGTKRDKRASKRTDGDTKGRPKPAKRSKGEASRLSAIRQGTRLSAAPDDDTKDRFSAASHRERKSPFSLLRTGVRRMVRALRGGE